MKFPQRGLYAITDTTAKTNAQIVAEVSAALKGGALIVQYRDKRPIEKQDLVAELLALCHSYNVPLLINDDVELAAQIGADGVHLGKQDTDLSVARAVLGANAIIGMSCYNDLERALNAEKNGADYVAFGRFFFSNSKPSATPAQLETLHQAKQCLKLPIVAIGGITPQNGATLVKAGADLLAVIGGLFHQADVEKAAHAYQHLFQT